MSEPLLCQRLIALAKKQLTVLEKAHKTCFEELREHLVAAAFKDPNLAHTLDVQSLRVNGQFKNWRDIPRPRLAQALLDQRLRRVLISLAATPLATWGDPGTTPPLPAEASEDDIVSALGLNPSGADPACQLLRLAQAYAQARMPAETKIAAPSEDTVPDDALLAAIPDDDPIWNNADPVAELERIAEDSRARVKAAALVEVHRALFRDELQIAERIDAALQAIRSLSGVEAQERARTIAGGLADIEALMHRGEDTSSARQQRRLQRETALVELCHRIDETAALPAAIRASIPVLALVALATPRLPTIFAEAISRRHATITDDGRIEQLRRQAAKITQTYAEELRRAECALPGISWSPSIATAAAETKGLERITEICAKIRPLHERLAQRPPLDERRATEDELDHLEASLRMSCRAPLNSPTSTPPQPEISHPQIPQPDATPAASPPPLLNAPSVVPEPDPIKGGATDSTVTLPFIKPMPAPLPPVTVQAQTLTPSQPLTITTSDAQPLHLELPPHLVSLEAFRKQRWITRDNRAIVAPWLEDGWADRVRQLFAECLATRRDWLARRAGQALAACTPDCLAQDVDAFLATCASPQTPSRQPVSQQAEAPRLAVQLRLIISAIHGDWWDDPEAALATARFPDHDLRRALLLQCRACLQARDLLRELRNLVHPPPLADCRTALVHAIHDFEDELNRCRHEVRRKLITEHCAQVWSMFLESTGPDLQHLLDFAQRQAAVGTAIIPASGVGRNSILAGYQREADGAQAREKDRSYMDRRAGRLEQTRGELVTALDQLVAALQPTQPEPERDELRELLEREHPLDGGDPLDQAITQRGWACLCQAASAAAPPSGADLVAIPLEERQLDPWLDLVESHDDSRIVTALVLDRSAPAADDDPLAGLRQRRGGARDPHIAWEQWRSEAEHALADAGLRMDNIEALGYPIDDQRRLIHQVRDRLEHARPFALLRLRHMARQMQTTISDSVNGILEHERERIQSQIERLEPNRRKIANDALRAGRLVDAWLLTDPRAASQPRHSCRESPWRSSIDHDAARTLLEQAAHAEPRDPRQRLAEVWISAPADREGGVMLRTAFYAWAFEERKISKGTHGAGEKDSLRPELSELDAGIGQLFQDRPSCMPQFRKHPGYDESHQLKMRFLGGWQGATSVRLARKFVSAEAPHHVALLFIPSLPADERLDLLRHFTNEGHAAGIIDDIDMCRLLGLQDEASHQSERDLVRLLEILLEQLPLGIVWCSPFTSYAPTEPASNHMFVGRKTDLDRLKMPNCSRLFAGRKLGKSALLRKLERQNTTADRIICVDIAGCHDAHKISRLVEQALAANRTPQRLVTPQMQIAVPTPPSTGLDPLAAIQQWLERNPNSRLTVLLDEADEFFEYEVRQVGEQSLSWKMKGLWQDSHARVRFICSGYRVTYQDRGAWGNWGFVHRLEPLEPNDAADLIRDPLARLGIDAAGLAPLIAYRCGYQPAALLRFGEMLCQEIARDLGSDPRERLPISTDMAAKVFNSDHMQEELRKLVRLNFTNNDIHDTHHAMAMLVFLELVRQLDHQPPRSGLADAEKSLLSEIRRRTGELPELNSRIHGALIELEERSLIRRENNRTFLRIPHHLTLLRAEATKATFAALEEGILRDVVPRMTNPGPLSANDVERIRSLNEAGETPVVIAGHWPEILCQQAKQQVARDLEFDYLGFPELRRLLKSEKVPYQHITGHRRWTREQISWWFMRSRNLTLPNDAAERIHDATFGIPLLIQAIDQTIGNCEEVDETLLLKAIDAAKQVRREAIGLRDGPGALLTREQEILRAVAGASRVCANARALHEAFSCWSDSRDIVSEFLPNQPLLPPGDGDDESITLLVLCGLLLAEGAPPYHWYELTPLQEGDPSIEMAKVLPVG